jgi:hypothetical protein
MWATAWRDQKLRDTGPELEQQARDALRLALERERLEQDGSLRRQEAAV